MSNLTILTQDLKGLDTVFSNTKTTSKEFKKDFSKILEGERNKQKKSIAENKSNTTVLDEEALKEKEINTKKKDKCHRTKDEGTEEITEKLVTMNKNLNEYLLNLISLLEEFDEVNLDILNTKIEEAFTTLKELLSQNIPSFSYEGYEEILKVFDDIHQLITSIESKTDIDMDWIWDTQLKFEEKIIELKDIIAPKILKDRKDINDIDHELNFEKEDNIIYLNHNETEEIEYDQDFSINKEFLKAEKPNIEHMEDIVENTNIEDVELNTPILQIENKALFKLNPEIQDKELQEIDKRLVFEQIVEKAKLILDENKQEIKIKLKPEILGELILKMEVEKGALLAKILVDNYRTKELLEANLYQFKEDMKENGLDIKTFEVFVGTNEDFERENRHEFNFNQRQSRLKIKNDEAREIKIYDEAPAKVIQRVYHEGQLDLFA